MTWITLNALTRGAWRGYNMNMMNRTAPAARPFPWSKPLDDAPTAPARRTNLRTDFVMPSRPADRSRNFSRNPQSVPRKNYR